MSELAADDEIVTIDGKQYSRLMAEEMARDIELAHSIRPGVWAITDDRRARLIVGNSLLMQLAVPNKYMYLVDKSRVRDDSKHWVERFGKPAEFAEEPDSYFVNLELQSLHESLPALRDAHEYYVRKYAEDRYTKTRVWNKHIPEYVEVLEQIVGKKLPIPAYSELPSVTPRLPKMSSSGFETDPEFLEACQFFSTIDQRILTEVTRVIHAAYEGNSNSFSFMKIKTSHFEVALLVGKYLVSLLREDSGIWAFPGSPSDDEYTDISAIDSTGVKLSPHAFRKKARSMDELLTLATFNPDAHIAVTKEFAQGVRTRTRFAAQHHPALLAALEFVSGRSLPRPDYMGDDQGVPIDVLSVATNSFAASGLHYTDTQIAAFYTSLQTKGVVVLSGISGTGKSKIATGFVEMLPVPTKVVAPKNTDERITFSVRPYMRKMHNVAFAKHYLDRFPSHSEPGASTVDLQIGEAVGTGKLRYEFPSGHRAVHLWIHKSLHQAVETWSDNETIVADLGFDDETQEVAHIQFTRLGDLAKSDVISVSQPNHLFLSVRPDWRDSTSLLGYYNPLTQTYEWTDFLKFLIRAGENYKESREDRIAWFVILDEMNLAHVEYYFADLLSVIESGRDAEGWTTEPLRLTYPDALALEDEAPPRELFLPPNLYIIGTVNMDETTHAFSPKVLDRAFTIELTDVDFRDYPPSGVALDSEGLDDATKAAMLAAFSRDGQFARIDKAEIAEFIERFPEVRDQLQALNDVLRPFRMHFGYRVFDEITQYLANNDQNGMATFEEALDQAVFMKVLPKFSGSRARLQSPLHGVLTWAVDPARTSGEDVAKAVEGLMLYESGKAIDAWEGDAIFPRVAERVRDMLVALERDGFVSFG